MTDARNSTTKKVLRTQRRVMGWTMFFWNLLALTLVFGFWLLWHVQDYIGGWELMDTVRLTYLDLIFREARLEIWLTMAAAGMEQSWWNVTGELQIMVTGVLVFWLLELLVNSVIQAVWRSRVRSHMQQVAQLAQEARRLGEEEAKRNFRAPQVDVLEEAIDHISPTQSTRLHIGDPDLKGLEDAVNDLLDRMQAAYSQQTRFVSDASHELRTPIAVLKGYADLLERWGKHDPQVRDEAITAIRAEAERMNRLVEQLLFLARGDSGRYQLQIKDVDLAGLTKEVWEESSMIDPGHSWVLDAPEPVSCRADRDMLKQALRILADNAAKYSPSGTTITLRAFTDESGSPCLAVRDQGIGVTAEDAAHLFDRFYRSDPARTRQSGGAGLGLSIADWIITQHGGAIRVYSWEGVGTRFTIVLPKDRS